MPPRFKRMLVLGRFALVGLAFLLLIPATSPAVTISLVPDRPPVIAIGETMEIDFFMVLDLSDQKVGISSTVFLVTFDFSIADAKSTVSPDSVFPGFRIFVEPNVLIGYSGRGTTVTKEVALLGTLPVTGRAPGSFDMAVRRIGTFPTFFAPGAPEDNRYDFSADDLVLTITIVPEPSSWLLLSLGIAGVVMLRRKLAFRA